jgi:replicative DNA helicase
MLTEIKRKLFEVESVFVNGNDGSLQSDVLEATFIEISDDCENVANGKPIGIPTGIYALGKLIGGFRSTNLIVLAARPGVGKTSLGLHFTTIAAKAGKWVNFYTMEMGKNDLQRIVLSGQTGVNRTSLRDGYLTDLDWSKLNERSNELSKLPIVWYDTPVTVEAITAKTIKNKRLNRCDMIVIDYLGLIKASDKRVNREQQVSNITASLKGLALEMKIPIILLSQLNREASNRKPILSDLRESGAIEQDADVVLFPYRDEAAGTYSIIIGKNRRGKCCEFEIFANDEMTVFGNLDNPPQLQQMIATETTLADEKYQMNPNRNFESESSPF